VAVVSGESDRLAGRAAGAGCSACQRNERQGGGFLLRTPHGSATKCLVCAVRYPPLVRRSIVIALIVGSVLLAINQGDALLAGRWDAALAWKAPLRR
jgi:hypothetical protein